MDTTSQSPTDHATVLERYYAEKHVDGRIGATVLGRHLRAAWLFQRYLQGPREVFLDIGCGAGAVAVHLQRALGFRRVCGVDLSSEAVQYAAARGVDARLADVGRDRLPFAEDSFDGALCSEVIEHLIDTDHLLQEIHRTLRPGGVAVLTTPNLASWINRLTLLLGWQPFMYDVSLRHKVGRPRLRASQTSGHLHMFTARAFRELVRLHGFRILQLSGLGYREDLTFAREARGAAHWGGTLPLFARMLLPLDSFMSKIPALGFGIIGAIQK